MDGDEDNDGAMGGGDVDGDNGLEDVGDGIGGGEERSRRRGERRMYVDVIQI